MPPQVGATIPRTWYLPRPLLGGPAERDRGYHNGAVWPWLAGPFIEAWVRVRGDTADARREARTRFLAPLLARTDQAGLDHLPEICDGDPPHRAAGCPFQASLSQVRLSRVLRQWPVPIPPPLPL